MPSPVPVMARQNSGRSRRLRASEAIKSELVHVIVVVACLDAAPSRYSMTFNVQKKFNHRKERQVDCFWRWSHFGGWLGIRDYVLIQKLIQLLPLKVPP